MDAKAPLSLKFVVIGASISGIACAYALRQAGHDVLVLEATDGSHRGEGGIRVPPNMTRILNDWSLRPLLDKWAVTCPEFIFRSDIASGEPLGILKLHAQMMDALNANFLLMKHGDLHTMLLELAMKAGAEFKYNVPIVEVDPWEVTATSSDGSIYTGDVILGADGLDSMIRNEVVLDDPPTAHFAHKIALEATVSTALMKQDEDLKSLTESAEWWVWMSDGAAANGHLIHGGEEFSLNVTINVEDDSTSFTESWKDKVAFDQVNFRFPFHDPRVFKFFELAGTAVPVKYIIRDSFDDWVHESGKVAVVGEAAHPFMPSCSHNAAMGIEDAAMLGSLFSRISSREQISTLLYAYEELRQPRCAETQKSEHERRDFIALPTGPIQELRDQGLRETLKQAALDWDDADEEFLRATYEAYIIIFAYDAGEMADDWWTKWGNTLERGKESQSESEFTSRARGASALSTVSVSVSSSA
ncbi:hypothetical protein PLICRDRAFT_45272 [Plicaturopsis crispa FD-325 SS-3]|uniref:FAD-binding domain-containing protein n=1 Tax=Plicaturopsis crispa FD-325 SS-3 TaxID=944288 RepID=A0A0C9TA22_PLICR|nr:hypothetical protein PLICRDRAFT_45272 [Plicaturopsis crispa FD-325 SS-3]